MTDDTFIQIAKALADPTRHAIVRELRESGELTCSQVCGEFSCSQPTISHHLKTFEAAGIISVREDGTFRRLTVNAALLEDFARAVQGTPAPARPKPAKKSPHPPRKR